MSYENVLIRESVGDGTIDPDDVCMVCDKRDCECPPEDDEPSLKSEFMRPGAKEIGDFGKPMTDLQILKTARRISNWSGVSFPSLLESAEEDRREILNAQVLSMFLAFCVVQCVAFAVATVVAT